MPTAAANGVRLFYALTGEAGPPLALVHGSWGNHTAWDLVVSTLAQRFRVLTYDRRGHSQSERSLAQGSAEEDAADLAALLEHLDLAPAHLVGNSFGASVALQLALLRPELVRNLALHEPPFLDLPLDEPAAARGVRAVKAGIEAVAARLAAGDAEGGATAHFLATASLPPSTAAVAVAVGQAILAPNAGHPVHAATGRVVAYVADGVLGVGPVPPTGVEPSGGAGRPLASEGRFGPGDTKILEAGAVGPLRNAGDTPLRLVLLAVAPATPIAIMADAD